MASEAELQRRLEIDVEFTQMAPELGRLIDQLDRVRKVRMKAWLAKLHEATNNPVWKKNRNAHAHLMLNQLRSNQALSEPFTKMPPQGPLPTLQQHLAYRFMGSPPPATRPASTSRPRTTTTTTTTTAAAAPVQPALMAAASFTSPLKAGSRLPAATDTMHEPQGTMRTHAASSGTRLPDPSHSTFSVIPAIESHEIRQEIEMVDGRTSLLEWRLSQAEHKLDTQEDEIAMAEQHHRESRAREAAKATLDTAIARLEQSSRGGTPGWPGVAVGTGQWGMIVGRGSAYPGGGATAVLLEDLRRASESPPSEPSFQLSGAAAAASAGKSPSPSSKAGRSLSPSSRADIDTAAEAETDLGASALAFNTVPVASEAGGRYEGGSPAARLSGVLGRIPSPRKRSPPSAINSNISPPTSLAIAPEVSRNGAPPSSSRDPQQSTQPRNSGEPNISHPHGAGTPGASLLAFSAALSPPRSVSSRLLPLPQLSPHLALTLLQPRQLLSPVAAKSTRSARPRGISSPTGSPRAATARASPIRNRNPEALPDSPSTVTFSFQHLPSSQSPLPRRQQQPRPEQQRGLPPPQRSRSPDLARAAPPPPPASNSLQRSLPTSYGALVGVAEWAPHPQELNQLGEELAAFETHVAGCSRRVEASFNHAKAAGGDEAAASQLRALRKAFMKLRSSLSLVRSRLGLRTAAVLSHQARLRTRQEMRPESRVGSRSPSRSPSPPPSGPVWRPGGGARSPCCGSARPSCLRGALATRDSLRAARSVARGLAAVSSSSRPASPQKPRQQSLAADLEAQIFDVAEALRALASSAGPENRRDSIRAEKERSEAAWEDHEASELLNSAGPLCDLLRHEEARAELEAEALAAAAAAAARRSSARSPVADAATSRSVERPAWLGGASHRAVRQTQAPDPTTTTRPGPQRSRSAAPARPGSRSVPSSRWAAASATHSPRPSRPAVGTLGGFSPLGGRPHSTYPSLVPVAASPLATGAAFGALPLGAPTTVGSPIQPLDLRSALRAAAQGRSRYSDQHHQHLPSHHRHHHQQQRMDAPEQPPVSPGAAAMRDKQFEPHLVSEMDLHAIRSDAQADALAGLLGGGPVGGMYSYDEDGRGFVLGLAASLPEQDVTGRPAVRLLPPELRERILSGGAETIQLSPQARAVSRWPLQSERDTWPPAPPAPHTTTRAAESGALREQVPSERLWASLKRLERDVANLDRTRPESVAPMIRSQPPQEWSRGPPFSQPHLSSHPGPLPFPAPSAGAHAPAPTHAPASTSDVPATLPPASAAPAISPLQQSLRDAAETEARSLAGFRSQYASVLREPPPLPHPTQHEQPESGPPSSFSNVPAAYSSGGGASASSWASQPTSAAPSSLQPSVPGAPHAPLPYGSASSGAAASESRLVRSRLRDGERFNQEVLFGFQELKARLGLDGGGLALVPNVPTSAPPRHAASTAASSASLMMLEYGQAYRSLRDSVLPPTEAPAMSAHPATAANGATLAAATGDDEGAGAAAPASLLRGPGFSGDSEGSDQERATARERARALYSMPKPSLSGTSRSPSSSRGAGLAEGGAVFGLHERLDLLRAHTEQLQHRMDTLSMASSAGPRSHL